MKKIISFLTAAALCVSMSVPAFASGFVQSMNTVEDNPGAINIIYNGQLMTYTDAVPENINDRVMLPFRAVLEGMGAEVDYDNDTRLVTAARKDTTIKFTLEDDTIYINSNGVDSELKLDVPMIIKNDRTLVPIRFISNALGMQVGWEGEYNTVLIVDSEAYSDDYVANTPNLTALTEKSKEKSAYNTSDVTFSMTLGDTSINAALKSITADNGISMSGTISAGAVTDAAAEIIMSGGKIYVKTDLFEKSAADGETAVMENKWYSVDADALAGMLLGDDAPDGMKELYASIFGGNAGALDSDLFSIADICETDGDATLESAMTADMIIDAYKAIDKYITVTDDKIEMNITPDNFINMLSAMMGGFSEDELKELSDALNVSIYALSEYGENEINSKADISMTAFDGMETNSLTLNLTETSKADETAKIAEIPSGAADLTPVLNALMK